MRQFTNTSLQSHQFTSLTKRQFPKESKRLNAIQKQSNSKNIKCNIITNTTAQKFVVVTFSPRLHLFNQKYTKSNNIVKYYRSFKKLFLMHLKIFIPAMTRSNFQQLLLQSSSVTCSFRNHSNWLICTLLSMLKTVMVLKEEHLLEVENV